MNKVCTIKLRGPFCCNFWTMCQLHCVLALPPPLFDSWFDFYFINSACSGAVIKTIQDIQLFIVTYCAL